MEPVSERRAFARAWTYLNYNAAAKWTALVAAVAAGVLYVLLLLVLRLFGDEMVYRGQVAAFDQLNPAEVDHFAEQWKEHGGDALGLLGLDKARSLDKSLVG